MPTTCRRCDGALSTDVPGWCTACGRAERVPARTLLAWLLPDAVDVATDAGEVDPDPLAWPGYAELRAQARADAGVDESVVVAHGHLRGHDVEVVAIVWEFGFLGGSMGTVAGRRIAAGYDHARAAGLPVVVLPSTGGARMQEGMASLVQMAATTVAASEHAGAGLLQVAVLRDPTTGGVFASHANLAHVVLAEPGATIGFAGPRVSAAMTGGPLPTGSHTAHGARAAGLVDHVVGRPDLPATLARWCRWPGPVTREHPAVPTGERTPPGDAWTEVARARATDRVRAGDVLAALVSDESPGGELHGDRAGGDDRSVRLAATTLHGRPVLLVAMDPTGGAVAPGGYRKAWRALALAARLRVPVVVLVDTPGADASAAAEAGGIAHHIARTFREVLTARTPVVAAVIGEGGSGGALALAVGDRLLVQEHAIFSVIAPEGAAAILYRDAGRAAEVADLLDPTAQRLLDLGIADEVVPEPAGAEVSALLATVARHLDELDTALATGGIDALVAARAQRWRRGWRG